MLQVLQSPAVITKRDVPKVRTKKDEIYKEQTQKIASYCCKGSKKQMTLLKLSNKRCVIFMQLFTIYIY